MFSSVSKIAHRFCQSYYPKTMDMSAPSTFYFKDLQKWTIPDASRKSPKFVLKDMTFGSTNSEHMLEVQWNQTWQKPRIKPFQQLRIHPFNSTLHYAIECYEGLKAYKDDKGIIRLFRPECNMLRFKHSSKRIGLPDFDGAELLKLLQEFVRLQARWIPTFSGSSLYLRPFHFSMENSLGIKSPKKSKLLLVASPVGPYYPTGFNPISVSCDLKHIRAAPGGTGGYKVGGNYGPTVSIAEKAIERGYQQLLWLYNGKVCQVGTSNIFFVIKNGDSTQVITPELEDIVLPGVTRDSIIKYVSSKGIKVTQRIIMIDQIVNHAKNGRLVQIFASGTAVIVSPIKKLQYNGQQFDIFVDKEKKAGHLTYDIFNNIIGMQEGRLPDPFGWSKIINP